MDNLRVVPFKPGITYRWVDRPRIQNRPRSGTDRWGRAFADGT